MIQSTRNQCKSKRGRIQKSGLVRQIWDFIPYSSNSGRPSFAHKRTLVQCPPLIILHTHKLWFKLSLVLSIRSSAFQCCRRKYIELVKIYHPDASSAPSEKFRFAFQCHPAFQAQSRIFFGPQTQTKHGSESDSTSYNSIQSFFNITAL